MQIIGAFGLFVSLAAMRISSKYEVFRALKTSNPPSESVRIWGLGKSSKVSFENVEGYSNVLVPGPKTYVI